MQPCTVSFNYKSEGQLQVYASMKVKEPDEFSCDKQKIGRPLKMNIVNETYSATAPPKANIFTQSYIYVTLESSTSLSVEVTASFYQPEARNKRKNKGQPTWRGHNEAYNFNELQKINDENETGVRKKARDIVDKNKAGV